MSENTDTQSTSVVRSSSISKVFDVAKDVELDAAVAPPPQLEAQLNCMADEEEVEEPTDAPGERGTATNVEAFSGDDGAPTAAAEFCAKWIRR